MSLQAVAIAAVEPITLCSLSAILPPSFLQQSPSFYVYSSFFPWVLIPPSFSQLQLHLGATHGDWTFAAAAPLPRPSLAIRQRQRRRRPTCEAARTVAFTPVPAPVVVHATSSVKWEWLYASFYVLNRLAPSRVPVPSSAPSTSSSSSFFAPPNVIRVAVSSHQYSPVL